jgi:hypothetical protein
MSPFRLMALAVVAGAGRVDAPKTEFPRLSPQTTQTVPQNVPSRLLALAVKARRRHRSQKEFPGRAVPCSSVPHSWIRDRSEEKEWVRGPELPDPR